MVNMIEKKISIEKVSPRNSPQLQKLLYVAQIGNK